MEDDQTNYKYDNFEGSNTKIIEIVSNYSGIGLLKKIGNDNLKVSLPLDLCIGYLNEIKNYDRSELEQYINSKETIPFKNGYSFKLEFNKLVEYVNKADKIRIWSSHLDCADYCLLLYLCNIFKDKNISVIFSEEFSWYTTTIGALSKEDLLILEQREHLLKQWEKEEFGKEWEDVLKDNCELRFMLNGKVKSVNIDYFNNDILERLKSLGKVNIYKLIANLMGNPIIPYVIYSDYIYIFLINRLIKKNLILETYENGIRMIEVLK